MRNWIILGVLTTIGYAMAWAIDRTTQPKPDPPPPPYEKFVVDGCDCANCQIEMRNAFIADYMPKSPLPTKFRAPDDKRKYGFGVVRIGRA